MKILKYCVSALLLFVVSIFVIGFFLPKTSYVERNIEIAASSALVFELVSQHKETRLWSPWAEMDPGMALSYEGPEKGVGSKVNWKSDHPKVGNGSSTFIEYTPYSSVAVRLAFDQGGGIARHNIEEISTGVKVNWSFEMESGNVIERYFGLMLDGMIGPEYEKGLAKLKKIAEAAPVVKEG